ncbi:MAG TPA: squalene/phytoene synthase family protein [Thermoanaerobaculia bacterium]|nr:squalene/phytoene synthase family protein [Thermoanaerobaculia bacterium]
MADFDDLLLKTSRTFALSIPLLEEPVRRQVTIAYLMFRIADTFEDAAVWTREERIRGLEKLGELLAGERTDVGEVARDWVARRPTEHEGYLELLSETPAVFAELASFDEPARRAIEHHTGRTVAGMARVVAGADDDGRLRLESLDELQEYCYIVAGIVGELLTDLFLLADPVLESVAARLRERAGIFGEALQLVNIVKDAADDREEGRRFLPRSLERERVFELARADLEVAQAYTEAIRSVGGSAGIVAFTTLPVRLAWAALEEVERRGPGAKVGRVEVMRIFDEVTRERESALAR